jgi:GT2 family glycosyltransferase
VRESPIRLRQAYAPLRQAYDSWRQYDAAVRRKAARIEYQRFQALFEPSSADLAQQRVDAAAWTQPPVFSIATAVFGPPFRVFRETVKSVRRQTYPHWRWHIVDASPTGRLWPYLKWLAAIDSRIQPVRLAENRGMAGNINSALQAANGDFVVMLDHDDTLAPFALHALARAVAARPDVDFLYSDCDKLDEKGQRCDPFFKPDWSPELLLGVNYLEHVAVFRRSLLDRVGLLDPACGGAYDWDFYLRIAEHTQAFAHLPQVLHHWRKTPTSTAQDIRNKPGIRLGQQRAVLAHLRRRGLREPTAEFEDLHPIHNHFPRLTWQIPAEPLVSIVIPTLDHAELLSVCLDGLFHRTSYRNIRIVLVDNGSQERATHKLYASLAARPNLRIVEYREPFNFSRACNVGVRHADGDLVLLLNNDIEMLHDDWLTRMVQWFEIPEVGVVGPKMFYPSGQLHHGGVVIGIGGLASILFIGGAEHVDSIYGPEGWYRNLSAVSGACLLTRRTIYDELGGLDEAFLLNYSDVDFCVRANARGHRVVFTPDARIVHHESVTHGRRVPRGDFLEASRSFARLLQHGDPFFNPNLSCFNTYPSLRRDRRDTPAATNADMLARLPHKAIIQLPDDVA